MHTLPPGKSSRLQPIQRVQSGIAPRLQRPEWMSPAIYSAIITSEKLVIELDIQRQLRNDNNAFIDYIRSDYARLSAVNPALKSLKPLHDYDIDQNLWNSLVTEAAARDLHIKHLAALPLPAVLLALSTRPIVNVSLLSLPGAEDWLVSLMRLHDREITGLEERDTRLEALSSVFVAGNDAAHIDILNDYIATSITTSADVLSDLNLLYHRWISGDVAARERNRSLFSDRYPAIYAAFIANRNHLWLEQIEKHINSGERVFIAVGESHLLGPDNLRKLLQDRGYAVERVN